MPKPVFPQMNTLVKVNEATILTSGEKLALINATDLGAAEKILDNKGFFKYGGGADFKVALEQERLGWLAWCEKISPVDGVADLFLLKGTVEILKKVIHSSLTGKEIEILEEMPMIYTIAELKQLVKNSEKSSAKPQWKSVVNLAVKDYAENTSLLRVDSILDSFYHLELLNLGKKLKEPAILEFISAYTEAFSVSILLQGEELGVEIPTFSSKSDGSGKRNYILVFTMFKEERKKYLEKTIYKDVPKEVQDIFADNHLLKLCGKAKLQPFGILPLCAFIFVKLGEIRDVRMILTCKSWNLSPDEIRKRVRVSYEL